MTGDGCWLSTRLDSLKEIIDGSLAKRAGPPPLKETVEANASLYVAPGAVPQLRQALGRILEWETHTKAVANGPVWLALYRSGVLSADASPEVQRSTALHYLGFAPVSPDGTAYRYDRRGLEVRNDRHGSPRHPELHAQLAERSPVGQLLEQFRTLRADLRFREDGIHTALTIERQPAK